jgi:putative ABC transport system permease protein
MENFTNDVLYATRMLLKKPAFTSIAILTLALGIGANTAIFSVVNAVLLRPLPYKEPQKLVMIWGNLHREGLEQVNASTPEFIDYKEQSKSFEQIAAYEWHGFNLTGGDQPHRVVGARVTASLFPLLGIQPALGRTFSDEEDRPGYEQVAVISHRLWQQRFGSDANITEKPIQLNGKSFTVVGVMPAGFDYPFNNIDVWRPMAFTDDEVKEGERGSHGLDVIARLKQGVTIEQAQAEMNSIAQRIAEQHQDSYPKGFGINLISRHEQTVGKIRPALLVLLGAVSFVLLITCANVANLLLARAATRRREIAIRAALGASRWRLIQQLLTESVLLAVAGGALGLLFAVWGIDALIALAPGDIPRLKEIGIDSSVLGFTLFISVATGLLFGLAPALQSSRLNLNESLKEGGKSSSVGVRGGKLRGLLVISEVALALTLLIGAGLMIKSFFNLNQVNTGFDAENALSARIVLTPEKYVEPEQKRAFFNQLIERVESLPGIQSVSVVSALPLGDITNDRSFIIEGREGMQGLPGDAQPTSDYVVISANYFQTMGIPILRGRQLNELDNKEPAAAVVNETFVRKFFSNQEPLGKRIKLGGLQSPFAWLSIVGVVGDVRHRGPDKEVKPEMYVPYLQPRLPSYPVGAMFLVVRAADNPTHLIASVRDEVQAIDKDQPLANIETMSQRLSESVSERRFNMLLLGIFASVALTIAAIGLYGVMSYFVTERTHEIGIRMALGAQPHEVLRLVLGQGAKLVLIGVATGVMSSLLLTRLMASLLFGVSATDAITFTIISLFLTGVALGACFVPARRATKVDPMIALRYE